MPLHNPPFTVDGHEDADEDSNWAGDGQYPPFRVFEVDAQDYLPGTYATRGAAQRVADLLNAGATALPALQAELIPGPAGERGEQRVTFVNGVKVKTGLYVIHWRGGGSSLAAIGMTNDGQWWVAPTNWQQPAELPIYSKSSTCWHDIERLERLASEGDE